MVSKPSPNNRDLYLQLIENEKILNGRYTTIKRIDHQGGNGNFSLMFYAYDQDNGKDVVLKFYNPDCIMDLDRLKRFQREGEILSRLKQQPNILEAYDNICSLSISVHRGSLALPFQFQFIPMERALGSIEQFIYDHKDRNPIECLLYFKEMCKSVARIHSKDICHRDLKPSNFLLFKRSIIKLGDFGTAKFLDGSMDDIRSHYISPVGDMRYCSPELLCNIGIGDNLAFCADIFALGAILFEIFTQELICDHIYSNKQNFWNNIMRLRAKLLTLPEKERYIYYISDIDSIINQRELPDIFAFNDFVPNSIKKHLNILYKSLADPNIEKRLNNFITIHRRIDICLLVLRNEFRYREYLKRKKR